MLGASILHGVDATQMKFHPDLKMRKFDRIIFNFPHAGFYGKEDNVQMIEMHRKLVRGFFRNASGMLRAEGEMHVRHKTSSPYCSWNIEELAWQSSLALIECVEFRKEDYPGYNNKRGDGKRCDDPFHLGECSTFKFILSVTASMRSALSSHTGFTFKRRQQFQNDAINPSIYWPTLLDQGCPQRSIDLTLHFQNDAIDQCIYRPTPLDQGCPQRSIDLTQHFQNDAINPSIYRPTLLDQGYPQRSIGQTLNDQVYPQTSFGLNTSRFLPQKSVQPSFSIRRRFSDRGYDHAFENCGYDADVGKFSSFESRQYEYRRQLIEAHGMCQQVEACSFKVNHRQVQIDAENSRAFPLNTELCSYSEAALSFTNRANYNHPMVTQSRADDFYGHWERDSRMDDFVRCKMEVHSRNLHLSHLKYVLDD